MKQFITSLRIFSLIVSLLFISGNFPGCKSLSTDPENPADSKTPEAKISATSNIINAGSYCILDGSPSQAGGDKLNYNWEADPANPDQIFISREDAVQIMAFIKEGLYKYRLRVSNGRDTSKTTQVEIRVNPRVSSQFEDPSLEAQVRYTLKIPVGDLTSQDLLKLDSLASYCMITKPICSLKGLESCTNLRFLHETLQKIPDISYLSNLIKLEVLELSQNWAIKDITPLKNLTNLKTLDLQANMVEDISVLENLTHLTYLNLIDNSINSLAPIGKLTDLNELWLSHSMDNNLSFIKSLSNLQLLWMPMCNLTDISPLKDLANLRKIYFDGNKINDISPLAGKKQMEWLYLDGNQITDIAVLENLENLTRLRISSNKITDIQPLVNNKGIGKGDTVELGGNPLNDTSINVYIPELRKRGARVFGF